MKFTTTVLIIIMFFALIFSQITKNAQHQVIEVISPIKFVVDINNNGVCESNEIYTLNLETFSTNPRKNLANQALKSLKLSSEDELKLGYLAESFAHEKLLYKQITIKNNKIYVDKQDYANLLQKEGLAFKHTSTNSPQIKAALSKLKKLNIVLLNNSNKKYHKLGCKYGQLSQNSLIIPISQLPKDAKPCKLCFDKIKHNKKYSHKKNKYFKKYQYTYATHIPFVKPPRTIYKEKGLTIYLTDMTRVLTPDNACKTDICKALVKEVNSSKTSIDFAIYGYTKIPVLERALHKAQTRGVKIRFVYDSDKKGENIYPDTKYLSTNFTNNNHDSTNAIMHNKFFIFDEKTVLTGSANISKTDMSGFNSNAVVVINSPEVASLYEQEFEQMYYGKFHNKKASIAKFNDYENLSIFFSPKDNAISTQIVPIIKTAKKYIYLPDFLVTHKELTAALVNAANRGVDVKLILDATNTHSSASKLKYLRQHRIKVKTENFAGKLHSKSIIIDDKYTIIGSMNLSSGGESENDENVLIFKNKPLTIFYRKFFEYLWQRIPDKWLKFNARSEAPESINSCFDGLDNDFDGKIDMKDDSCKLKLYRSKQKQKSKRINYHKIHKQFKK